MTSVIETVADSVVVPAGISICAPLSCVTTAASPAAMVIDTGVGSTTSGSSPQTARPSSSRSLSSTSVSPAGKHPVNSFPLRRPALKVFQIVQ